MIAQEVTVGERGQIVIPKSIRELVGILPHQQVRVVATPTSISIQTRLVKEAPEDAFLKALQQTGLTTKDWREIEKERKTDDR